jgi:hypothetical protein
VSRPDRDGLYRGETWAETPVDVAGYVEWHSDGSTTYVDMIETNASVPLLGVRLVRFLQQCTGEKLDPGLMNAAGKRLWKLYRSRYR